MANTTIKVVTPKLKTLTAATAALLDTAVATQVNTLIQAYVNPQNATGATSGAVVNGSVVIQNTGTYANSQDATTFWASITWQEFVIPS